MDWTIIIHLWIILECTILVGEIVCTERYSLEIVSPGSMNIISASSLPMTGPAFDLAVSELRERYSQKFTSRVTYLYDKSFKTCADETESMENMVADYYYHRTVISNATVFIVPGCLGDVVPLGKMAAAWNQLFMIGISTNAVFRNKRFYPSVIQASQVWIERTALAMLEFFRKFHWKTIIVVRDNDDDNSYIGATNSRMFGATLAAGGCTFESLTYDIRLVNGSKSLSNALRIIQNTARVISFWGHALSLRKFMVSAPKPEVIVDVPKIALYPKPDKLRVDIEKDPFLTCTFLQTIRAYQANMTSENYVYVFFEVFDVPSFLYGTCTWQANDEEDAVAFEAYKALFVLSPMSTRSSIEMEEYNRILVQLVDRSKRDYNYTYGPNQSPTPSVVSTYAAVMVLGQVLNEVISLENDVKIKELLASTSLLYERIASHSFYTRAGVLAFDERGERIIRFDIKQLDTSSGGFKVIFRQNQTSMALSFFNVNEISWQAGQPPPDRPPCGYDGLDVKCLRNGHQQLIGLVSGLVTAGLVMVLCVFYLISRSFFQTDEQQFDRFKLTPDYLLPLTKRVNGSVIAYTANECLCLQF